jgi:AraC family transcriptional regulator of adaptative response/methylated-DNA-[protein]-cysteine methyltransferase
VRFFAGCAQAEAAGFRPCKRCAPHLLAADTEAVQRLCAYIAAHLDTRLTLAELGAVVNFSPGHVQRVFKRLVGVSPRQYIEALRLEQVKSRLKAGSSVTAALYEAGYSSSSRLYERAAERLGMTPAAYGRGGMGVMIRYTLLDSALGWVLIAGTDRGVCAVSLGDDAAALESRLHSDFDGADIQRDDAALAAWADAVRRHLDGQQAALDLPLDVRGTAFQRRVWDALRAIPYGETRTYRDIAASLGQPTAARAVGSACGSNPASLVIPCHRAVRTDGGLGGYEWGLSRKAALLEQERERAHP